MEFSEQDLEFAIEAIDKISSHKNRPNLPRIARYLYRIHDFSSHKTIKILEHLLTENRVKEVVYKGNISYRNPLRWKWKRNFSNDSRTDALGNSLIVNTIKSLNDNNPGLIKTGVSECQLGMAALVNYPSMTIDEVKELINSELEMETVTKNSNGLLMLSSSINEDADPLSVQNSSEDMSDGSDTNPTKETEEPVNSSPPEEIPVPSAPTIPTNNTSASQLSVTPVTDIQTPEIKEKAVMKLSVKKVVNTPVVQQAVRKGDRITRKRTKYDPSEYFFPPLVRKKKPNHHGSHAVKEEKKPKKVYEKKKKPVKEARISKAALSANSSLSYCFSSSDTLEQSLKEAIAAPVKSGTQQTALLQGIPKANIILKDEKVIEEATYSSVCFLCQKGVNCLENFPLNGQPIATQCTACHRIGHLKCIEKDKEKKPGSNKWLCVVCRSLRDNHCKICLSPATADQNGDRILLMCDWCEELYHADCHKDPPPPSSLWTVEIDPESSFNYARASWRCCNCEPKCGEDPIPSDTMLLKQSLIGASPDLFSKVGTALFTSNNAQKRTSVPDAILSDPLAVKLRVYKKRSKSVDQRPEETSSSSSTTSSSVSSDNKAMSLSPPEAASGAILQKPAGITVRKSSTRPRLAYQEDDPIPDVDGWDSDKVSLYFKHRLGDTIADAFLNRKVNGETLKGMSRSDVTEGLGLTLGAALKTLYIVRKIQRNTCDLVSLWAAD